MKKIYIFYVFMIINISKNEAQKQEPYRAPGKAKISELITTTIKELNKLWEYLSETNSVLDKTVTQKDLLKYFIQLNGNITEIENSIQKKDFVLLMSLWTYAQTEADVTSINSYYDTFKRLQDEMTSGLTHSKLTWTDLAETYLQNNDFGVIRIVEKLHRHVTDSDPINLFEQALQELGIKLCERTMSAHQLLYNLYNTITLADFKGYIMMQCSYMILKMYDKGNFTNESQRETMKFERRLQEKATAIRNALASADRGFYKCDPNQYVEGVTYVRLTKLLQGYIENEVNLNPYGTCRENCAYYYYTEYHGCFKEQFCAKQDPCRGKVVECRYVDSDMNICKSSDSERRYDWVEYENKRVLGTKGKCRSRNLFQVDSWWRYLFWHCSYCLCLCDDGNHGSDRYFNLREVTSDIQDNKVITGVAIVKYNKIIHFKIQQGVLLPNGLIDVSTLTWKPVDNYTIHDSDVKNGIDYHTMSWLDRILDIDEISGPSEHVLTGIRLRKLGHHLNLEIRTTPVNYTTGRIFSHEHSTWFGNDNTEVSVLKPRKEIILTNPDIPIRNGQHVVDSEPNSFIRFQATSMDTDAGQNTIPYFDTQPLTSHGFPLSGFGLIHRGKPGSGGFVAPKLISYDHMPHV